MVILKIALVGGRAAHAAEAAHKRAEAGRVAFEAVFEPLVGELEGRLSGALASLARVSAEALESRSARTLNTRLFRKVN